MGQHYNAKIISKNSFEASKFKIVNKTKKKALKILMFTKHFNLDICIQKYLHEQ